MSGLTARVVAAVRTPGGPLRVVEPGSRIVIRPTPPQTSCSIERTNVSTGPVRILGPLRERSRPTGPVATPRDRSASPRATAADRMPEEQHVTRGAERLGTSEELLGRIGLQPLLERARPSAVENTDRGSRPGRTYLAPLCTCDRGPRRGPRRTGPASWCRGASRRGTRRRRSGSGLDDAARATERSASSWRGSRDRRWRRSRAWVPPARRDRQDEHQGNELRDPIFRTRVALVEHGA